jgi:hypothetical protein
MLFPICPQVDAGKGHGLLDGGRLPCSAYGTVCQVLGGVYPHTQRHQQPCDGRRRQRDGQGVDRQAAFQRSGRWATPVRAPVDMPFLRPAITESPRKGGGYEGWRRIIKHPLHLECKYLRARSVRAPLATSGQVASAHVPTHSQLERSFIHEMDAPADLSDLAYAPRLRHAVY